VLGLDIFVLDGLTSLNVNPTSVLVTLNRSLGMLNEAHDPGLFSLHPSSKNSPNAPISHRVRELPHCPTSAKQPPSPGQPFQVGCFFFVQMAQSPFCGRVVRESQISCWHRAEW